jgi:type I restriction enzyme S subunit
LPVIRIGDVNSGPGGKYFEGTYPEEVLISNGDLLISMSGDFKIREWSHGPGLLNQRVCKIDFKTDAVLKRFVFHYLEVPLQKAHETTSMSVLKNLSNAVLGDMLIPIPPLKVQKEIVSILDKFIELEAELKAELEAELEARSLQSSIYRNRLLDFDSDQKWSTLDEIAEYVNGKAHEKLVHSAGTIPLVTARFVSRNGEANRYLHPEDVLTPANRGDVALVLSDLPNGRALARSFFVDADNSYAINQRIARLRVRDSNLVDPRFMFYFLDRNPELLKHDNGVDQTHLSKSQVTGLKFPILELELQQSIVRALDSMESHLQNISFGIPVEITARRQQYEYYRNKLLTFKELKAS